MFGGQDETHSSADLVSDRRPVDVFPVWRTSSDLWSYRTRSFGNHWLTEGKTATLLLDADLRFFGAMMIGIGVIFFWTIAKLEALGSVIYILACAVALGAGARIYARIAYGNPGTAGTIPVIIESLIPVLLIVLRYYVGKEVKEKVK